MSERDDLNEQAFHSPDVKHGRGGLYEMGGELFTGDEWRVLQTYARGHTMSYIQDHGLDMQDGVRRFHEAMGQPVSDKPHALEPHRVPVRKELIREEFEDELIPALESGDMVETADACIDIIYVTLGLLTEMGLDAGVLFREVQESNMSKLGEDGKGIIAGPNDPDGIFEGRVKKGPNYFRPNLARLIESGEADLNKETHA